MVCGNEAKYRVIGIAIVVDELHKGQRLVCRYPESVPAAVLNSTEELLKFHEEYLSLSPDNFAKLFRPKASLFNKILELTIDDLHYISFPCPCSDELSTDTSIQTATDVISLFNIVVVTVRESAMKKLEAIPGTNSTNYQKRKNYSQHEMTGLDPVAVALGLQSHTQAVRPKVLRRIVETVSCALLNQEKRNRYVSKQVALMLRLQEETMHSQLQYSLQQQITPSNNLPNDNAKKPTNATSGNTSTDNIGKKTHIHPTQMPNDISNFVATLSSGNGNSAVTVASPQRRASFVNPSSPMTDSILPATSISPTATIDREGTPREIIPRELIPREVIPNQVIPREVIPREVIPREVIPNAYSGSMNNTTTVLTISPDKNLQVMESMQQQSSLANELRQIYHGLVGGHSVNLMVNGVISINIRLNEDINELKPRPTESKNKGNEILHSSSNRLEHCTENSHLSMLTIADKEEMLDIINCINSSLTSSSSRKSSDINGITINESSKIDSNLKSGFSGANVGVSSHNCFSLHPDLQELVLSLDPTVSIDELCMLLEQPLVEIFSMCDHLLNWGLGRFITTVTSDRRYKVTSNAPVEATSLAAKSFASKFYEPLNAAVDYLELELKTLIEEELEQHQELQKQIDEKNIQESRRKAELNGGTNSSVSLNIANSRPFSSPSYSSNGNPSSQSKGNSMFNFSHLNNPAARRNNDTNDRRNSDNSDREVVKPLKKGSTMDLDSLKDDIIPKKYDSKSPAQFISKYSTERMDYTLPCILAVFNGFQTLDKAIRKLPLPLHQYGVDIVIWLLRWKMVEEVHIYMIILPDCNQEVPVLDKNQPLLEEVRSNMEGDAKNGIALNEIELDMYHKIYPYLNGILPLHEIAW
eukprot:CAMPEP_0119037084 /NCGR_PEP_ID=MMETSP1177-20130426/5198_1 /TAXON_ID=2985 /ORGANISM="Ochromonas sp, Strain CCMP1899" /LENGTH=873 /DNA_ID=CAMNT_0006997833 /DNA_START=22 /DNA_END=2640 /DNA_ORIENTATION=+